VHINTSQSFNDPNTEFSKLLLALTEAKRESLVRGIRISAKQLRKYKFKVLQQLLSSLKRLEWIRIRWDHPVDERYDQRLVETIVNFSPRLTSLEIPSIDLDYTTLDLIFSTLPELETYKGQLPSQDYVDEDEDGEDAPLKPFLPNLVCKLRNVVLAHPVNDECFTRLLRLSHEILTSLGVTFDSLSTDLDLSVFPNLLDLRLHLKDSFYRWGDVFRGPNGIFGGGPEGLAPYRLDCARRLRKMLRSTRSIKSLSIIDLTNSINVGLSDYRIFHVLPKSLVHLSTYPVFLSTYFLNGSILAHAVRNGLLPKLKRITITPLIVPQPHQEEDYMRRLTEQNFRESYEDFGIVVDRAVPALKERHYHSGWAIDPNGECSGSESEEDESEEVESEEDESESDEETTSEEE